VAQQLAPSALALPGSGQGEARGARSKKFTPFLVTVRFFSGGRPKTTGKCPRINAASHNNPWLLGFVEGEATFSDLKGLVP